MMEAMVRVAAVAVTGAVLSTVLRKHTPELALLLILGAGLCCLGITVQALRAALTLMEELFRLTGLEEELLLPVGKVVALSLLTHITGELCRGTGERGMAAFVETAGTALALGTALPLIRAVTVLMGELLG